MSSILRDTVHELWKRKVLFLFGSVTVIMLLGVYITGEVGTELSRQAGRDAAVEDFLGPLAPWIAAVFSKVMTVLVFLAVLTTVGLVPRALEKGRAEFYLARPMSRGRFLMSKLMSIWLVYGFVAVTCGFITYAMTAAVHGVFDITILYLFAIYMLAFLIWISVVGLIGIATGSTVWAMTAAFVTWVAQWLLSFHEAINQLVGTPLVKYVITILYYIVPKTGEVGDMAVDMAVGRSISSWMPLWSSLIFAAFALYLAIWTFKRRDY